MKENYAELFQPFKIGKVPRPETAAQWMTQWGLKSWNTAYTFSGSVISSTVRAGAQMSYVSL